MIQFNSLKYATTFWTQQLLSHIIHQETDGLKLSKSINETSLTTKMKEKKRSTVPTPSRKHEI